MNEQRFWLVSLTGIVLLLGLIYWLHRPGDEAGGPAALSPEDVATLISEAVTPLQETIAEQAVALDAMAGTQRQLASAVEQSGLREALEQEIAQNAEQTRDSLKADLVRYEARLDDLQAQAGHRRP